MNKSLSFLAFYILLYQKIYAQTLTVISDGLVYTFQSSEKIYATSLVQHASIWPNIDGVYWIWENVDNSKSKTVLFIRCFDVPGIPTRSYITIAADDNFTLFLNGRLVEMKSSTSSTLTDIDMLSNTVQGNNCLHIIVQNTVRYGGLIFKATINY